MSKDSKLAAYRHICGDGVIEISWATNVDARSSDAPPSYDESTPKGIKLVLTQKGRTFATLVLDESIAKMRVSGFSFTPEALFDVLSEKPEVKFEPTLSLYNLTWKINITLTKQVPITFRLVEIKQPEEKGQTQAEMQALVLRVKELEDILKDFSITTQFAALNSRIMNLENKLKEASSAQVANLESRITILEAKLKEGEDARRKMAGHFNDELRLLWSECNVSRSRQTEIGTSVGALEARVDILALAGVASYSVVKDIFTAITGSVTKP